jgi:uncharacterized protein (UPF0261 family)
MAIGIVGMLDEREAGLGVIKDHIEKRGHKALLIDISIGTGAISSALKADVTCDEVARAGGITIGAVREMLAKERDKATTTMAGGLGKTLLDHHQSGKLEGVIAVGGMTGTFISLSALKLLPFGVP